MRRAIPPQHGAWAMLVVPFVAGMLDAGPHWLHAPLFVAWIVGYLLSYQVFIAVKTRRPGRNRDLLIGFGTVTAVAAVPVLLARPEVLWFAPAFAPLLAVNAWYAHRRRERATVNGLVSATLGSLMVLVAAVAAGDPARDALPTFAAVLLYFAGTVLYVKTMIRERGEAVYVRASVAYHVVALAAATAIAWPLAVPFAWFLVRAVAMPRRRPAPTPKQVGLLEFAGSVALLATLALT